MVRLPDGADDFTVAATLRDRGVTVSPLSGFFSDSSDVAAAHGLVCGYSRLPETQADVVAEIIADEIRRQ